MSFKIGDRVIIIVTKFDSDKLVHSGNHGKITGSLQRVMPENKEGWEVRWDGGTQCITYYPEHLMSEDGHLPMTPPEMELDEIERAEEIMGELTK